MKYSQGLLAPNQKTALDKSSFLVRRANCKPGSVSVGHLSGPFVAKGLKRFIDSWAGQPVFAISLQQAGFTSLVRHRTKLWAFTLYIA